MRAPIGLRRLVDRAFLGRLVRAPLALIPRGAVVPIVSGPLRGSKWMVGAGPHGYWIGTYEGDKQRLLQKLLRRGDCFLDVGANVGFYTLLAARLVGPTGQVFAFEPLPRNLVFLRRHVRMNAADNVSIFEGAVADKSGTATFAAGRNPSMGALAEGAALVVKVDTLDNLLARGQIGAPRIIKIDVEGAEAAVLRGASVLLSQLRPVLVLSGHGYQRQEECGRILAERGYQLRIERDGTQDGMYESVAFPAGCV